MKYLNYLVFDFETGGLSASKNPATEIAMLAIDGESLETKGTYQSLIKPYNDKLTYDQKALDVTGITLEMLNNRGKEIKTVVSELKDFIVENTTHKGAKWKPILVGHNAQFDVSFFQQIFHSCKDDYSKFVATKEDLYETPYPSYIDTVTLISQAYGNDEKLANWKLPTVCEHVGIELNDAHRAMNDVISTAELFKFLTKRLRSSQVSSSDGDRSRFRTSFQIL